MRKKFTMLFAALLACVGVMKAEVNSELISKKITVGEDATTLSTDQWYVLYNHGRGVCVSEETTAFKMRSTPANDVLAQNVAGMLFKLVAVEGQSDQYNVVSGNGLYFKFPANNTSAVSNDPVAFEIKTIGENAGHFYIKQVDNGNIADGQGNGEGFVCWGTTVPTGTGGNNCYHFKPVSLEAVSLVDVTYKYYVGDELKHTEVVTNQIVGSAVSAPTFGFVSFTAPTGTISATNKEFYIDCTLQDVPVTFSTVENPVWQIVEMHRYGGERFWQYNSEDKKVDVEYYTNSKFELASNNKLWCFVGNHFGFRIYNKEAGMDATLNATSSRLSVGEASNNNDIWYFATSSAVQGANVTCFTHDKANYMNRQGDGKIGYYNSNDNGSTCYIYNPSDIVKPAAATLLANAQVSGVPAGAVGTYPSNLVESLDEAIKANPATIDDLISLSAISAEVNNAKVTFGEGYYRLICVAPKTGNNGDTNYNTLTYNGANHLVTAPRDDKNINQIFEFIATETEGKYYLQSPNAAKCLNNIAAGSYRAQLVEQSSDNAGKLSVSSYNATQYKVAGSYPLFAENHPNEAVPYACAGWDDGANSPSAWYLVPVTELEISINEFASICMPFDVKVEDATAYAVTATNENSATLTEKEDIPAGEGAILEGNGPAKLVLTTAKSNWDDNKLEGTYVNTYVEGAAYVLANGKNDVGLYKAALNKDAEGNTVTENGTHFLNNANKAYLPAPAGAAAPMFSFNRGEGTSSIEDVELINDNVVIYDITGRRVEKMEKGIYIVNGKKVLVK